MEETRTDLILLIYKGPDVLFKFIHPTDILKKKKSQDVGYTVKFWTVFREFFLASTKHAAPVV